MPMQDSTQSQLTLIQVLDAKEHRAKVQNALRTEYGASVVSMTLNMPGAVKYQSDWLDALYDAAIRLRVGFASRNMRLYEERIIHTPAGPAFIMAVRGSAENIKLLTVSLEESLEWGRLLDLDVFSDKGELISRSTLNLPPRKCLICSETAAICIRSMRHSKEDVVLAALKLMDHFIEAKGKPFMESGLNNTSKPDRTCQSIGKLALEAMLMEVAATPAPGLVDRFNSGAHDDMDMMTFIKSSSAVSDAMVEFAEAGNTHEGPLTQLLPKLRRIGIRAEYDMYSATKGVNTQKGILFLLGILTAAGGYVLSPSASPILKEDACSSEKIAQIASNICEGIVMRELEVLHRIRPDRDLTAGEQFYLDNGHTGVRGEIEHGLPTVLKFGLPLLKEALALGATENDALIHALIGLMTSTEDTTILHRHNLKILKKVQSDAVNILKSGGYLTPEGKNSVAELDKYYCNEHISPGGSADLLAATWYLYRFEEMFSKK